MKSTDVVEGIRNEGVVLGGVEDALHDELRAAWAKFVGHTQGSDERVPDCGSCVLRQFVESRANEAQADYKLGEDAIAHFFAKIAKIDFPRRHGVSSSKLNSSDSATS